MPLTKARRFKPQARLRTRTVKHWWQARKADVLTVTPHVTRVLFHSPLNVKPCLSSWLTWLDNSKMDIDRLYWGIAGVLFHSPLSMKPCLSSWLTWLDDAEVGVSWLSCIGVLPGYCFILLWAWTMFVFLIDLAGRCWGGCQLSELYWGIAGVLFHSPLGRKRGVGLGDVFELDNVRGAGIARWKCLGSLVTGSILPWRNFLVEGIFPLELTWVQTPFPKKLFRMRV